MDDIQIIDLYWDRSEAAISETEKKYGRLCNSIAQNVLGNREDAEESVSDTYLAAWNAMPSHRPGNLMAFLAKITRRLAIKRWRANVAAKRGGGQMHLVLDELHDCASTQPNGEEAAMNRELYDAMNCFLDQLPELERTVFLRRYFLMDKASDIGASFGFTQSKVNSMLRRTRMKLKDYLAKEGYL